MHRCSHGANGCNDRQNDGCREEERGDDGSRHVKSGDEKGQYGRLHEAHEGGAHSHGASLGGQIYPRAAANPWSSSLVPACRRGYTRHCALLGSACPTRRLRCWPHKERTLARWPWRCFRYRTPAPSAARGGSRSKDGARRSFNSNRRFDCERFRQDVGRKARCCVSDMADGANDTLLSAEPF